jgi:hypothetical protein
MRRWKLVILRDNKVRKWKKGTRLFGTYHTYEKKLQRWGRRCHIIWWKPCKYYHTDELPRWSSECPYRATEATYPAGGSVNGECLTYGYQPRFGKVSNLSCNQIKDYYTDKEVEEMEKAGTLTRPHWWR